MNPTEQIDPKERHAKGYDCEKATFVKYSKEISIRDYVQAGKDGTEIKEIIQKAGGLEQIKRFNKELPTSDIEIDLNMNPILANKILKAGQVAQAQIDYQKALKAELEEYDNKKMDELDEIKTKKKGGEE